MPHVGEKNMLVTFTCDANENIIMLGDVAVRLIKMMGHSGVVPSAILADDVPAALERLQRAIEKQSGIAPSHPCSEESDLPVSLKHRALPLIQLLQNAIKSHCDVLWC